MFNDQVKFKSNEFRKNLEGIFDQAPKLLLKYAMNKRKAGRIKDKSKHFQTNSKNDNQSLPQVYLSSYQKILESHKDSEKMDIGLNKQIHKRIKQHANIQLLEKEGRSLLWQTISHSKYMQGQNQNYFKNILLLDDEDDRYTQQIEMDLKRTCEQGPSYAIMKNVLIAYARRNPFIGYCQGMNYLVWQIIKHVQEEAEAFWLLAQLLEGLLPLDYYSNIFGFLVDQRILMSMLEIKLPKIYLKFNSLKFDPTIFTIQWYICLFTQHFQQSVFICMNAFQIRDVIWDNLLLDGSKTLFQASLAFFKILKQDILNASSFVDLYMIMQNGVKLVNDAQKFQKQMHKFYISKTLLRYIIEIYRQNYTKEYDKMNASKALKQCKQNHPICESLMDKSNVNGRSISFFVFKEENQPKIIQNYIIPQKKIQQNITAEALLVGKYYHICNSYIKDNQFIQKRKQSQNQEIEMKEFTQRNSVQIIKQIDSHIQIIDDYILKDKPQNSGIQIIDQYQESSDEDQDIDINYFEEKRIIDDSFLYSLQQLEKIKLSTGTQYDDSQPFPEINKEILMIYSNNNSMDEQKSLDYTDYQ